MTLFRNTGESALGRVSPERLRHLGKMASAKYASGKQLSAAVLDTLKDEPGLGLEHIKRVTEFANLYAFDHDFAKMGGDHKVVDFVGGPADVSSIVKELEMSPSPIRQSPSFSQPTGYTPGQDGIEAIFGGHRKTASQMVRTEDYKSLNPHGGVVDLYEKLSAAKSKIASDLSFIGINYDSAVDNMCKEARQILLQGHSPVDVSSVVYAGAPNDILVKLALKIISERTGDVADVVEFKKEASVKFVNSEHPLYQSVVEFCKVASDRFTYVAALDKINEQLGTVRNQLKGVR